MRGFKGERVLMRIHVSEQDRYHGKPLFEQVVELLRQRGGAGATVLRGLMGFGASSRLHDARSEYLFADLPLVIECVDTEARIRDVLPELDRMIGGGLITLERVKVIMYRPHREGEAEDSTTPDDWSLDITGAWPAQPSPGTTAPPDR